MHSEEPTRNISPNLRVLTHLMSRQHDGLDAGRLLRLGLLDGRVEDVSFDARLGDDTDAHDATGTAIVVHGVQNR